jgi:hypothetical protein
LPADLAAYHVTDGPTNWSAKPSAYFKPLFSADNATELSALHAAKLEAH